MVEHSARPFKHNVFYNFREISVFFVVPLQNVSL